MRTSASLSAIGRRVISWNRVPTLDTSRQMSMTRCCMITTAAASAVLEGRARSGWRASAASSGCGVERGLDDGDDDLVLVGEDPEDRALGDAGRLGDLAGRDPVAVLEQQRQRRPRRSSTAARRAAAPSPVVVFVAVLRPAHRGPSYLSEPSLIQLKAPLRYGQVVVVTGRWSFAARSVVCFLVSPGAPEAVAE